jgi:hypothetical protein
VTASPSPNQSMVTSWLAPGAGTGPAAAAQACILEPCSSRVWPSGPTGAGSCPEVGRGTWRCAPATG